MYGFFANSYHVIKIRQLKNKVQSLQTNLNNARATRDSLLQQLRVTQGELYSLETHCYSLKINRQVIEQELNRLQSERNQLEQQHIQIVKELQQANEMKDYFQEQLAKVKSDLQNLQNQIENIKSQMTSISQNINALDAKISEYDSIIANKPQPIEKTGRYCENGHENCPNLPNNAIRTVVINKNEIAAYEVKLQNAITQREQCIERKSELQNQYATLQNQLQQLEEEYNRQQQSEANLQQNYDTAVEYYESCHQMSDQFQLELDQNETLLRQANQDLNNAVTEENQAESEVESLRGKIYSLENQVNQQETDIQHIEYNLSDAEFELNQAIADYQALQSSSSNQSQDNISSYQTEPDQNQNNLGTSLDAMAGMAIEELKAQGVNVEEALEKIKSDIQSGINHVKDLRDNAKQFLSDLATTVSDIYPSLAGLTVKAIFDGPHGIRREFFGEEPEHGGNLFIDHANQR